MTPTIQQSSAPIARPRLLELSRQVTVDFQPDADFDERRRCPSHGFLPFVGQYYGRSSAYPGSLRIQEIKIIAFVYDPGSRFHPNLSARAVSVRWPPGHASPHDDAAAGSRSTSTGFTPVGRPIHPWEASSSRRGRHIEAPACTLVAPSCLSTVKRRNRSYPFHVSPRPSPDCPPAFQKHCFDEAAPTLSRRELTFRSIGVFSIGPTFQACERTIL
jgi:hypothetical protein